MNSRKKWYYSINGSQHGPISTEDLADLARKGALKPADLVWKDDFKDWHAASSIKGLFPASAPPPLPPQPVRETPPVAPAALSGPFSRVFTIVSAVVGAAAVFLCAGACCLIPSFSDIADPWNVPHPGKQSYGSLSELAKDFDSVYLVDPTTLNYGDDIQQTAIAISEKGKYATIYLRFLTRFEKFDADLLRRRGHDANPGVRYIVESNRVRFDYGFDVRVRGFENTRVSRSDEYTLTDNERLKE